MKLSNVSQKAIEILMQNLANKSPSDSFLCLSLVSGESDINAFLSITSKHGKFDYNKYGFEPLSVVELLSKDLLDQLKIWKANKKF